MRSLAESSMRWQETVKHSGSLADLRRAVKFNGPNSPCIAGCRSVCWKAFLLGDGSSPDCWSQTVLNSRGAYASLREHYLKYIKHPEYLAEVASDPLADDPDSPWHTHRQDEILRGEILQDVQRLPDEPLYHHDHIQTLILDVLFIYCKLNPDVGGYRQGMHELLAPIVYVLEQDAIDPSEAPSGESSDPLMGQMLDAAFIEHDAFTLFSKVMERAKDFYETGEGQANVESAIVEKSQHIHENLLFKVDPDLSDHLKNIEVLPQIFLIRWIRLLFSREFPFDQMLVLWDTLFSVDPTLQLIDLVCTAMLIRIRWDLIEADYSVALQLLLKYPPPLAPHGPHTFVDDAVYLRDHLNENGGSTLIMKYTGKVPTQSRSSSRPAPRRSSRSSQRANGRGVRSPLSPPRFLQNTGGVEALFQGAAKGVLERGEKLGISQAVRDALVEIRRNVNEARTSMKAGFAEPGLNSTAMRAVAAMDQRNRQLATMLDEAFTNLKTLATSGLEDKPKISEALEIAAAKIQFVKVHLEDSTMLLSEERPIASPPASARRRAPRKEVAAEPPTDVVAAMAINDSPEMAVDSPDPDASGIDLSRMAISEEPALPSHPENSTPLDHDKMDTDDTQHPPAHPSVPRSTTPQQPIRSSPPPQPPTSQLQRPQPPVPTRSTLAQSSFSWMLEPDEPVSAPHSTPTPTDKMLFHSRPGDFSPPSHSHRKRPSANANRERTAFLFGEVPSDGSGSGTGRVPPDLFGLEDINIRRKQGGGGMS